MATNAARKPDEKIASTQLRLATASAKRAKGPIVGGILLVLVAAFLFGNQSLRAGHRNAVIAVANPVAAGHVLTANDLKVVHVADDGGISPIASSQMASIVGRPAAVGLVPNTLLTEGALGASSALTSSDAQVGVALKPGLFPPGLATGATVRIVNTETGSATLADGATVTSVGSDANSSTGTTTIGLKVPAGAANGIASAAAADHVSIVEVAGR